MSTKIYNAYRTTSSIHAVFKAFQSAKPILQEGWRDLVRGMLRGVVREESEGDRHCDLNVAMLICDEILKGYNGLNPVCSAVVYPRSDCILFQFFGVDRSQWEDIKRRFAHLKAEDFHYQNQSDAPDDVSDKEWTARRKVWDQVFKDSWMPSEAGLPFDFITKEKAIEIVWTEFSRANPPLRFNGKWPEKPENSFGGPESVGIWMSSDYQRWWNNQRSVGDFPKVNRERLHPKESVVTETHYETRP